jgi:hypothetical protein
LSLPSKLAVTETPQGQLKYTDECGISGLMYEAFYQRTKFRILMSGKMLLNLKKDNQIHKTQDRFKTSLSQRTLVESVSSQPVKWDINY